MQQQTKLLYNTRTQPKEYNKKDSQQSKQTPERIMQEDNKETAALGGGQVGDSDIEVGQQQQQRQQQQQQQQSRRGTMAEGNGVAPVSGDLNQPQQQQEKLFGNVRETKVVWILKLSMVVLLTFLAIVGAAVIYFVSHDTEVTSFEEASHDHAHKVLQGLGSSIDLTLGAVDSFVVSLSNYADASNSTWPFVTLPNHAIQFAKLRSLAKAFYLCLVPLVTLENRPEWEEYTVEHGGPWVEEDLEMQKKDYNYHGIVLEDYELNHKIYTTDGDAEGPGPFFPTWQAYPIVPKWWPFNWDYSTFAPFHLARTQVIDHKRVALSSVNNFPKSDEPFHIDQAKISRDWGVDFVGSDEDGSEPYIDIFYPILKGSATDMFDEPKNSTFEDEPVVAVMTIILYIRDLIRNILSETSDGIVVVFENTANQTFTYEINGPDTKYLGIGDKHNPKYNRLEDKSTWVDLNYFATQASTYTGVPLSSEGCQYTIRAYPSERMEARFVTNQPMIYTVSVVVVFALATAGFLLFDRCVERKNRTLMYTAIQQLEEANRNIVQASASQLKHFACMSHEIRTPLNCIIGLSGLLKESELSSSQEENIDLIVSNGELLMAVVNDVLDYSKLESGNVDIRIQLCDLEALLKAAVRNVETESESTSVSVRTYYDPLLVRYIDTDSRRLQQILNNLLGNARKFSRDWGIVELHVEHCSADSYLESRYHGPRSYSPNRIATLDGHVLKFVVKDYGRGLRENEYKHIFSPFRQGVDSTDVKCGGTGGTGLGLSITAKLVQALGGEISVISEKNFYSEFCVAFPFKGRLADVDLISNRLSEATVFLVGDESQIGASISRQVAEIFQLYRIDYMALASMKELVDKYLETGGSFILNGERSYIYLVDEALYDENTYKVLSAATPHSVLITFGRKQVVKECQWHAQSLDHVLPTVLLEQMAKCLEEQTGEKLCQTSCTSSGGACPAECGDLRDLRILVAEDNVVNQKVLARILDRLGVKNVTVVENGRKAVDREAAEAFDVCLMDMQMPVMDGVTATRLISQRQGGHPRTRVVFVSAHVLDEVELECYDAGGCDFISKPCRVEDIKACLERVVQFRGAQETRAQRDSLSCWISRD